MYYLTESNFRESVRSRYHNFNLMSWFHKFSFCLDRKTALEERLPSFLNRENKFLQNLKKVTKAETLRMWIKNIFIYLNFDGRPKVPSVWCKILPTWCKNFNVLCKIFLIWWKNIWCKSFVIWCKVFTFAWNFF